MKFAAATGLDVPIPTLPCTPIANAKSPGLTIRIVEKDTPTRDRTSTPEVANAIPPPATPIHMPETPRHTPTPTSLLTPSPSLSRGGTPKSPLLHRTPKPSLSFRSRDKPSPGTPPSRPRGMTFPHGSGGGDSGYAMHKSSSHRTLRGMPQTPTPDRSLLDSCLKENEEDANGDDADSIVSFAPSTGGKNIAHWFSGLLGRS
ncbi:hypothetical protein CFE70_007034 [Pyrenophora teres f. teres 0-1]|uniref:Uncharacterized protein n=2 Tax=Pyrenophora teres f. teres TaxID=97479 RepID=E3RQ07_PYRTT|nr:hypothetical protein PTT_10765 [Pyrenophora teres f. teres 0-1]KAE8835070.1 hypothetical protein PTNB85_06403 [Pyrenophora teres f. teres]KAE8861359.1 hypothetical protein PTNB29_06454 [Pyrenophora teres f. teres]KAK1908392.1 hypothetical protein P3342_009241 [Pyrenophora teres f. teres]CAE7192620.1 hypothetical protein PTTW11_07587 [Pyrenophora teres f. teres]